jgi:hypothetical protein
VLGTLDLTMNRRVRRASVLGDLCEAQLQVGVTKQQGEDLSLLLRPQDRQERRGRPSFRKVKITLQFADTSEAFASGVARRQTVHCPFCMARAAWMAPAGPSARGQVHVTVFIWLLN